MVPLEWLNRYQLVDHLTQDQQRAIARVADECVYPSGATIFAKGQPSESLYLLLEGRVDLCRPPCPEPVTASSVVEYNNGEPHSLLAQLQCPQFTATAKAITNSRILKIDASALRGLCETDSKLNYIWMAWIRSRVLYLRAECRHVIVECLPAEMLMDA